MEEPSMTTEASDTGSPRPGMSRVASIRSTQNTLRCSSDPSPEPKS